ncbi:MAG: fatty acid desaturase [Proteobacteria bacterium]|nr:fatty acid desaturase [Pseudomonadota bacterium]
MNTNTIKMSDFTPVKPSVIFAHSGWDIFPVMIGLSHLLFQIGLFFAFPHLPWLALIPLGLLYAYCIAWNIESVAHNFTHNNYFKSHALNRAFSLVESLAIGFSQQFYKGVHRRHHIGNSDRPDADGNTRDWFSIYRYGKDGMAESAWTYCLFGLFRGPSEEVYSDMEKVGSKDDVRWAKIENYAQRGWFALGFIINWKFMLYFMPFYYLGHVFSMMVGYYEHYQANPDLPIAWGVSTYGRLYNLFWLNNGYHAEHHYRPRIHWTQMRALRDAILQQDHAKDIHVIRHSHLLGFLDAR